LIGAGAYTSLYSTFGEAYYDIFYFAYAFNFNFCTKVILDLSFIYFFTFSIFIAAALVTDANLGGSAGLAFINSS